MNTSSPNPLHHSYCGEGHLLLRARDLQVGYGGVPLLPPLSLELRCGGFLAVVGRNGAGKTTLFRTLLDLLPPVAGEVERHDPSVAYVPQRVAFDPLFPVSVREVVAMGLLGIPGQGLSRAERRDRVQAAMDELEIAPLAPRRFRTLSEGQKQKVLMARVMAAGARLVFLDEPTAAMDAVAERETMDLLAHLQRKHGMALVVVNHHMQVALELADRVLFLDPGAPEPLLGPPEAVITHPAFEARYGKAAFEVSHAG